MRFTFQIGLLGAALAVSLQAQHAGNGGARSMSRGGVALPSFSSGYRPSTGITGPPSTGFASSPGSFIRRPVNSRPNTGRTGPYRYRAYSPLAFGSYFNPFYSSFDSAFDYGSGPSAYPPDSGGQTAEVTANLLAEQMQRLSDQVQQLGAQQYNAVPYAPYAPPEQAAIPVTVILRSGQQIQVQNYAVMDNSFWDFSRQPARRIPLSTIDIAASTKATEEKGGQFPAI